MADRETKGPNQSNWRKFSKVAALWLLIILASVMLAQLINTEEVGQDITYTKLMSEVQSGNVAEVTFINRTAVDGTFRTAVTVTEGVPPVSRFRTELPVMDSESLVQALTAANVSIAARGADRDWLAMVLGFLPWLLIIAF